MGPGLVAWRGISTQGWERGYAPGMDLPAGYELRSATPDDLDAVADVFSADDTGEAGQVVLDADFLRDEWNRAGFDLATDAWVVVDPAGTIVGYVQAMLEEPNVECWGGRPPRARGAGHRRGASGSGRGAGVRS